MPDLRTYVRACECHRAGLRLPGDPAASQCASIYSSALASAIIARGTVAAMSSTQVTGLPDRSAPTQAAHVSWGDVHSTRKWPAKGPSYLLLRFLSKTGRRGGERRLESRSLDLSKLIARLSASPGDARLVNVNVNRKSSASRGSGSVWIESSRRENAVCIRSSRAGRGYSSAQARHACNRSTLCIKR
jgi:hypothetical protein